MTEARCLHFGSCGGCKMQHLAYDEQLELKEEMVRSLFLDHPIERIIGCEEPWRWRNKMEFSFSQAKSGERFLGLMMRGKPRVVTLQECHLTQEWFIEVLQRVYEWWEESGYPAYFPPADRGLLRTLTLREGVHTGEKMAVLTVVNEGVVEGFAELLSDLDCVIVRRQISSKGVATRFEEELLVGPGYIEEKLGKYRFRIRPSTFFQPNTVQAEVLYNEIANLIEGETLLDLYCGTGSIGIFCSERVKRVVGVELVPGAEENVALNGISTMEVRVGDCEHEPFPQADTVVVDPPRAGLGPKTLAKLGEFKRIIYVSCNPKSQARDIAKLEGHEVTFLQPVDQFPHTLHVENIALLEKR